MTPTVLDSRAGLGSDVNRDVPRRNRYVESSACATEFFAVKTVRVVLGRLGPVFRFSAHDLGIVVDGQTIAQAWDSFLSAARDRDDTAWLMFDVGPTRPEEVEQGLDAPEFEDWAEPAPDEEAD